MYCVFSIRVHNTRAKCVCVHCKIGTEIVYVKYLFCCSWIFDTRSHSFPIQRSDLMFYGFAENVIIRKKSWIIIIIIRRVWCDWVQSVAQKVLHFRHVRFERQKSNLNFLHLSGSQEESIALLRSIYYSIIILYWWDEMCVWCVIYETWYLMWSKCEMVEMCVCKVSYLMPAGAYQEWDETTRAAWTEMFCIRFALNCDTET